MRKPLKYSTIGCIILLTAISLIGEANDSLRNGQELFRKHCASCHQQGRDLIGPDLTGIHERRKREWLVAFIQNSTQLIESGDPEAIEIFNEYQQVLMPPALINQKEIEQVLEYISQWKSPETKNIKSALKESNTASQEKPKSYIKYFFFLLTGLILLYLFLSFFIFIKFNRKKPLSNFEYLLYQLNVFIFKRVPFSFYIINTMLIFAIILIIQSGRPATQITEYEQDVIFSHEVHYSDYDIHCLYCHYSTHRKAYATIPDKNHCMKCHDYIRKGDLYDDKEIGKLIRFVENNEDIRWKDHFQLAEYAHFNHALHIRAGKLQCTDCHTDIKNIEIQQHTFDMKWCMDCHKKEQVDLSNKYYIRVALSRDQNKVKDSLSFLVSDWGGLNCSACHY